MTPRQRIVTLHYRHEVAVGSAQLSQFDLSAQPHVRGRWHRRPATVGAHKPLKGHAHLGWWPRVPKSACRKLAKYDVPRTAERTPILCGHHVAPPPTDVSESQHPICRRTAKMNQISSLLMGRIARSQIPCQLCHRVVPKAKPNPLPQWQTAGPRRPFTKTATRRAQPQQSSSSSQSQSTGAPSMERMREHYNKKNTTVM